MTVKQLLQKQEEMRKQSKQVIMRKKNVKSLLEELTIRDIESTQIKVHQVIERQKANYKELHQLKNSSHLPHFSINHRRQSLSLKKQISTPREKQNISYQGVQGSTSKININLQTDQVKEKSTLRLKKYGISSQRYSKHCSVKQSGVIDLPVISSNLSKRSSLQTMMRIEGEKIRKPESYLTELAIIKEEKGLHPTHLRTLGATFSKLQKQISWQAPNSLQ